MDTSFLRLISSEGNKDATKMEEYVSIVLRLAVIIIVNSVIWDEFLRREMQSKVVVAGLQIRHAYDWALRMHDWRRRYFHGVWVSAWTERLFDRSASKSMRS